MASPSGGRRLPALSEYAWLRFGAFFLFYVVQGLPIGLTMRAFPAWLTAREFSATAIGSFVAVTSAPWVLKFIAGPIMDRFSYPPMGLRRPWVIGAQTLLVLASMALFFIHDARDQFLALMVACTAMNIFAAFQDVAVDGMAVTLLLEHERGRANAFMIGGQVAGTALTGAGAVPLLNLHGVPAAGALLVVTVGIIGLSALLLRERPGERLLPWTEGEPHPEAPKPIRNTPRLFVEVVRLLVLPMSLVLLATELSYRLLEGVTLVWWPAVAINTLGFSDEQYARWSSLADMVTIVAGLALGFLVDRFTPRRGALAGLMLGATVYGTLWFLQARLQEPAFAVVAMMLATTGSQLMFIATVSLFMGLCGKRVAASQFAIYMALSNLGRNTGAWIYGQLSDVIPPEQVYAFMAAGYVISILLLLAFNPARHRERLVQLGEA